jgi:hypothetical protein
VPLPLGAAMADRETATAWVLVEGSSPRGLGAALAWAQRESTQNLHVLVDGPGATAAVLARRASLLTGVTVWHVEGREVAAAAPASFPVVPPLPPEVAVMADRLRRHGIEPVVEHGVLMGEVLGLEVCRAVTGDDGRFRLETGVGRNDRQARALLLADRDVDDALDEVVETIRRWRRPGVRAHPANTIAVERWLRATVVARPDLVDAAFLASVPPVLERHDLTHAVPAPAAGEDISGRPLLVVCSAGIDLDLVPSAADAWLADGRNPVLRLVVPAGDDHPAIRRMAASLLCPADVAAVPSDWRALA